MVHDVGNDMHKPRKGSKVHLAVDTLGQLLAAAVTPANEPKRAQVAELTAKVQEVTGAAVAIALVDKGHTATETAAETATCKPPAFKPATCKPPAFKPATCNPAARKPPPATPLPGDGLAP
jgi:hypothetical protein